MSDSLRELYQEVILDHNRRPRNFRSLEEPDRRADGHNPLCGDQLTVFVRLEGERIAEVTFLGEGCAISKASASLMTEALKGRTVAEADALFAGFHELVAGDGAPAVEVGKLAVFKGVRDFPVRVKCATLAWHTIQAALHRPRQTATTE